MNASDTRFSSLLFAVALFLVLIGGSTVAQAGEVSVYLKSGYFTWDEKLNGASFVKETGAMFGAGVAHQGEVAGLKLAELAEVWGGNLNYDGHDLTNTTKIDSDTSYLGTREEGSLGIRLPLPAGFSVEPFVGMGHKFWIRTRSGEDWNTIYAKVGVGSDVAIGESTVFAKAGLLMPLYTRNHVSLASAGYSDVVTEPKSLPSAFAEAGVKRGAFALSVEYEGMRFGESDKVPTSRLAGNPGAVIQNNQAFQPDSEAHLFSLKLAYSF
ncbi:hypothetical protein GMLC_28210 [Geomonas limicola]|uniref:Outer membrane protein beta-barrel domain-containing protein n=1 Tax=Geomonas limicola TaxID=2740186 RepID=A0A6V8N9I5_9BACT|nr:hypothetical protein [Geomonas limicola]GFO69242.1 hypothetical protein GMLC_28210 [Geomonas limicola]